MDFTKKANDFGLFGNVLVVNNDIVESVSAAKTAEKEAVLMIAAHVTNEAIRNQMKDGKLSAFEGCQHHCFRFYQYHSCHSKSQGH